MIKYLKDKKREREILHNYLEVLAKEYENIEPVEMTNSICEIYDRLNPSRQFSIKSCFLAFGFVTLSNLIVCCMLRGIYHILFRVLIQINLDFEYKAVPVLQIHLMGKYINQFYQT